jgi:hypothetical protein
MWRSLKALEIIAICARLADEGIRMTGLWIDVKKTQPEEMTTVLVTLDMGLVTIGFRTGDNEWELDLERIWLSPSERVNVTHWMTLPTPAAEDELPTFYPQQLN